MSYRSKKGMNKTAHASFIAVKEQFILMKNSCINKRRVQIRFPFVA